MQIHQEPIIPTNTPVSQLISPGFEKLSPKEQAYAYHFARASWEGSKICYFQKSFESPGLFYIFHTIFANENVVERLTKLGWSQIQIDHLNVYVATFFQNCGNYKSFGDSKFIPELPKEKFYEFIKTSPKYSEQIEQIWQLVHEPMYNYQGVFGLIDLKSKGGSNSYYSPNLQAEEIEELDKFLNSKNISELNTRVLLVDNQYKVLVASSEHKAVVQLGELHGKQVQLHFGDYYPFLASLVHELEQAIPYAANENQVHMLADYISHFKTGDVELHKQSQRHWIKDKGPAVESNIGFIETYLDPMKVRAEFEGFVAVVNKEESKLLNGLVDSAEKVIQLLPWPKEFEIDVYKRPDFTSLEVLAFGSSGTPLGINIPNYDDIRQQEGFKNVNLGNTVGKMDKDFIKFLSEEDKDLYYKYHQEAIFVVVALHELIGHGAGKLFYENQYGSLNFDQDNIINPITGEKVTTFYKHNEQWHAKFGELSGAYEECKADATALYLSTDDEIVKLLLPNHTAEERKNIVTVGWLFVVYRAIVGLEFYNPELKKWGQAHVAARNVILQQLIREDPEILKIENTNKDGLPYIIVKFDHERIYTTGKQAISKLILHLQIYKSIAAGTQGQEYFKNLAEMSPQFLKIREITLMHKVPRRIELQPEIVHENGVYQLKQFEISHLGVIQSHIAHHRENIEQMKDLFLSAQIQFRQ